MPNWVEPPLPEAIALIIRSTSTPALSPSAIASAVAAMLMATRGLLTSLTLVAAPHGRNEPLRAVHPLVHRLGPRHAGQHDVALLADVGWRFGRHAAGLLEV